MESSDSIQEIYKSLVKAQGEFSAIPFDAKNPHFGNKYASLTGTQEHVRPILSKHGLGLIQSVESLESRYYVQSRLIHESGEWIQSSIELMVDKKNMQGLGSATTYAKRYAAQAILGLSGDEDDDGNAAAKDYSHKAPPQKKAYEKVAPEDYVLDMGSLKGQKLGDLSLDQLGPVEDFLSNHIKEKKGTEKQRKFYGFVLSQVRIVQGQKEPRDTPPSPEQEPEGLGMDDFEPPLETTNSVIDRLKKEHGGES